MHSYYSQQCTISKCYIFGLFLSLLSNAFKISEISLDLWILVIRLFGLIFVLFGTLKSCVYKFQKFLTLPGQSRFSAQQCSPNFRRPLDCFISSFGSFFERKKEDEMCLNIGQTHDKIFCKNLFKNAYIKDAQQGKVKGRVYVIQCSWEIMKEKTHEKSMLHACSGPQDQSLGKKQCGYKTIKFPFGFVLNKNYCHTLIEVTKYIVMFILPNC